MDNTPRAKQKTYSLWVPILVLSVGFAIAGVVFVLRGGIASLVVPPNVNQAQVAKDIGVSGNALEQCEQDTSVIARVEADMEEGQKVGGKGTPFSIVIAPDGRKFPIYGALPYESVKQLVDLVLSDTSKELGTGPTLPILDKMRPIDDSDHIRGDKNAPVKIVVYTDYDCPFCKFYHSVMKKVMDTYGDSGKVAWVQRYNPQESIHPEAKKKAITGECIARLTGEDNFWRYSDVLMREEEK